MPRRRPMASELLWAERIRQANIEQDERTRLAIDEARAKRALYGDYGRDVQAAPLDPPKER